MVPYNFPDLPGVTYRILKDLQNTPFAASSLDVLPGGTANFIYRAKLGTPLEDGTKEVLIKHGEDYIASNPTVNLTSSRCRAEGECLRALSKFPAVGKAAGAPGINFVVDIPRFYYFDDQNNTQVYGYLPNSRDLKTYALQRYPEDTPKTLRRQCSQLGKALGTWLRNFHDWAATQPELRDRFASNHEVKQLKHMINFSWLLDRITMFPSVLGDARDIFEEVKNMATAELEAESQLQPIHGDFWTGNIILPDSPMREGDNFPVFVTDWELAHVGVPSLDLGQMIAEMYELKLYKNITAGLWMVQGFVEGYGRVTEDMAFRTTVQVGVHLVCFGTMVEGWGTPEQVEMVARTGKDIIVRAWRKDREWFEAGDLACLFAHIEGG
ncbi:kinase-like domain-containing protein [Biscogniauxia mediterranea]|nr:kinase-like domain-containing protein [Biscogniauxia mediterranea]